MFWSRLFGFVAVTLCLVAFVCAHGAGNKETAISAVREAKKLTEEVLKKVQPKYRDAEDIKEQVESRKAKAEKAAKDAENAAEKGNTEAIAFAEKAKTALSEYLQFYQNAKVEAEKAFVYANDLLTKARQLDNKAQTLAVPDTATEAECSQLSANAADFKKEAQEIEGNITVAAALIGTAKTKLSKLIDLAEKALIAGNQVDAIVKAVEIENMLNKADNDIKSIEDKKKEVNITVEAIKEIFKSTPEDVIPQIDGFLTNAEGDLRRITNDIKEVQQYKTNMLLHKTYANEVLQEIKDETDASKVRQHLQGVVHAAKQAEESFAKITKALQLADTHVKNVHHRKEGLQQALSQTYNNASGEIHKSAKKPEPHAEEKSTPQTKKGTNQTVENNQEQSVQNAAIHPENKDKEELVENNAEEIRNDGTRTPASMGPQLTVEKNAEELTNLRTTKPVNEGTEQTVENNEKQSVKDKIKEIVKNEVLSPSNVINDNAITATFSLPFALICFAALHGGY